MMEETNASNDLQTPPTVPIINSSSRRKQSKPNRLEHIALETPAAVVETVTPSLTQYHVAAEQQQESAYVDDESDRISLNCEDGSLSSHSPDGNYATDDVANQSRRSSHSVSRSNDKVNVDENVEHMLTESNDQQDEQIHSQSNNSSATILDFSLKLDDTNKNLFNSTNRPRSLNPNGKARSGKRKHQNGNIDGKQSSLNAPTRIFHADAFCSICRKEFCNKYFLKTHLANKHGIFDPQSIVSSLSAPTMLPLQGVKDSNSDSSLQHSYTMVSALIQNGQEDFSPSTSSDLIENHQNNDDDENESELGSLKHQMNGVIAGDEDHQPDDDQNINNNNDENDEDNDDDDEQDGSNVNRLMNLPQQIASILRNDSLKRNSMSMLNDHDNMDDDDDNDQRENANNSPTNSLDYQHQQHQASSSQPTPSTSIIATPTSNISRHNSTKSAEDFCDICQKHFCNKYYLRKHKLDVHGVQTDCNIKPYKRIDSSSLLNKNSSTSSSAQQIPSSIQLPSAFSSVAFNASSVQQSLGMLLNPIFSPLVQSQNNSDSTSLSSNKRRYTDNSNESSCSSSVNAATLTKSQFPPSLLSVASDVAHAFANQLASVANNSTSSATSAIVASTASAASGGKSQISTCHLCGKKFQSNDYLQLHLMNKHQISTDLQTLESLEQRNKSSNLIKSSNGSLNSSTVKKIKLETNETPSTSTTATSVKVSTPSTASDSLAASATGSAVIPGIVDTYFAAKMADRVSCNICHKQVCNKYFLKTHKLKVHGVGPDSTVTTSSSNLLNNGDTGDDMSESQQQSRSSCDASPPQLVVDEMNSMTNEPGVIPSPDALTASVNTCIGTNNNASSNSSNDSTEQPKTSICEICSQSFPTKFLHVHMNNAHGIQQAPIIVNGTASTKTALIPGTLKRSMSNGSVVIPTNNARLKQTPQVQLRVTCQVCKKELCNKYFLRAHMRNVHNISVDDLRLIQPSSQQLNTSQLSPAADSPTSKPTFSLSSNLLSSTSTNLTDSNQTLTNQLSSLNDNESNNFNGHTTDSNDSENLNLSKEMNQYSSSLATSFKSATNDNNNNNNRVLSMQPFLVESDDDLYKDLFVPCMVYLPCRHRVTKPLEISLRLKPVDNNNAAGAATATTSTATIAD